MAKRCDNCESSPCRCPSDEGRAAAAKLKAEETANPDVKVRAEARIICPVRDCPPWVATTLQLVNEDETEVQYAGACANGHQLQLVLSKETM